MLPAHFCLALSFVVSLALSRFVGAPLAGVFGLIATFAYYEDENENEEEEKVEKVENIHSKIAIALGQAKQREKEEEKDNDNNAFNGGDGMLYLLGSDDNDDENHVARFLTSGDDDDDDDDSVPSIVFDNDEHIDAWRSEGGRAHQEIRGATLVKLIEWITSMRGKDPFYPFVLDAFFLTYTTMCGPLQLIGLLRKRFASACDDCDDGGGGGPLRERSREKARSTVKFESWFVLKKMVEVRWCDFAVEYQRELESGERSALIAELDTLIGEMLAEAYRMRRRQERQRQSPLGGDLKSAELRKTTSSMLIGAVSALQDGIERRKEVHPRRLVDRLQPPRLSEPVSPRLSDGGSRIASVRDIDPTEFARQLTLIEFDFFRKIHSDELLSSDRWSDESKEQRAPHVLLCVRSFNRLTKWIRTIILSSPPLGSRHRGKLIEYFVRVALACRQVANLNALVAVCSALGSVDVSRLAKAFRHVPSALLAEYESFANVLTQRNFRYLRQRLNSTPPPAMPYLGMFLGDIEHITVAHPDRLAEHPHLFNWERRCMIARTLRHLQQFQVHPFAFAIEPSIQQYLLHVVHNANEGFDDEQLYALSLECEPLRHSSATVGDD
jgi:RasGEF domain/RasGEF N-terminal motif